MERISRWFSGCLVLLTGAFLWTGLVGAQVLTSAHGPNSAAAQASPYVVLVSLDGFRYDYAQKYGARHLLAIASHGASAPQGMLPSYPSLTFPNHITLVTGLYPEHHGIIANTFWDPVRGKRYSMRDQAAVSDGSWYRGVPIWSLAEKQGMRTACFFWPGSEAEIAGERPSYYVHFDDKFDEEKRMTQVLNWLRLPAENRPHLITLYYSAVDHAGHDFGPDSEQTRKAVLHLDELMGRLEAGLKELRLPVDLVIVSDHGMQKIEGTWINLDSFADLSNFETIGPLLYPKSDADAEKAYRQFVRKPTAEFQVFRRKDVPAGLNYNEDPREGDPVIVLRGPYAVRGHGPQPGKEDRAPLVGDHGFDPRVLPTMKASFFAEGPDIRRGIELAPFENVNLYPLLAHLLHLTAGKTDGSLNVLSGILLDQGESAPADVAGKK